MLTLFFTLTFLAELIVANWIITKIIKFNNQVKEINVRVIEYQPLLKRSIQKTHGKITKSLNSLNCFVQFVADKKHECKELCSKNIITSIVCLIVKLPYKQIFSALEVILAIKKIIK